MRRSGFTLIELLIVVAIIAILAAIAVPNFLEAQTRAKVSRAKADMRSLATAIESYRIDGNAYPVAGQWVSWSMDRPTPDNFNNRMLGLTTPVSYITSLPLDPFVNREDIYPFDENPTYEYEDIQTAVVTVGFGASMLHYNLFQNENAYSLYFGGNEGSPVQWNLLSAGPDRRNDFQQSSLPIQESNALLLGYANIYDPTNGTVSRGDVYRTNVSQRE